MRFNYTIQLERNCTLNEDFERFVFKPKNIVYITDYKKDDKTGYTTVYIDNGDIVNGSNIKEFTIKSNKISSIDVIDKY